MRTKDAAALDWLNPAPGERLSGFDAGSRAWLVPGKPFVLGGTLLSRGGPTWEFYRESWNCRRENPVVSVHVESNEMPVFDERPRDLQDPTWTRGWRMLDGTVVEVRSGSAYRLLVFHRAPDELPLSCACAPAIAAAFPDDAARILDEIERWERLAIDRPPGVGCRICGWNSSSHKFTDLDTAGEFNSGGSVSDAPSLLARFCRGCVTVLARPDRRDDVLARLVRALARDPDHAETLLPALERLHGRATQGARPCIVCKKATGWPVRPLRPGQRTFSICSECFRLGIPFTSPQPYFGKFVDIWLSFPGMIDASTSLRPLLSRWNRLETLEPPPAALVQRLAERLVAETREPWARGWAWKLLARAPALETVLRPALRS